MVQLTTHKRFRRLFELSESDVWLPKLFRQTVAQCWPGSGKAAVTELVARFLDQAGLIVSRLQRTAASGSNQRTFVS